jgi:hypothetical protein
MSSQHFLRSNGKILVKLDMKLRLWRSTAVLLLKLIQTEIVKQQILYYDLSLKVY